LNGTDNLQLSADEQLVTITPTVNQATGGGHEIPVLVGDRACCLPKSTPEFFGLRKENVTEWLMVVENKFVTSKIDESNKVSTLLEFIKGDAGIMALSHIAKQGYDWIHFREHLINTHQPVNEQRKLKKELKEWKQNGQSLCDYNKNTSVPVLNIGGAKFSLISFRKIKQINYVQAQNEIMHDVTMSEAITIPDDEDLDYEVGWDLESDAKIEVKSSIPLNFFECCIQS